MTAVLTDTVETPSSSGYSRYACAPCREQRGLVLAAGTPERLAS